MLFVANDFGFSCVIGVFVWSYGPGAYFDFVYVVFILVVVSVCPVSFVFSVCIVSAGFAAVDLAVMVLFKFSTAICTFTFGVFNLDVHVLPR